MTTATNKAKVLAFLTAKKLPIAAVAGIAGNMQIESGFSTTAVNKREGAIGLCQWEGGRRTALKALAKKRKSTETNIDTQLAYLWQELSGPYKGVLAYLKKATDPAAAAAYVDEHFEISTGEVRAQREAAAVKIAGELAKKSKTPAPAAPAKSKPTNKPPVAAKSPTPAPGTTYTVVKNDTLTGLARKFGVTVAALVAANRKAYPSLGVNENLIQIGWRLTIPFSK